MSRFGSWSIRRMMYFVPLVRRHGVPFHMTPNDIKLTKTPFKHRVHLDKQMEFRELDGVQVISDNDFPYFVAGLFTRTVINTLITQDSMGFFMTIGAAACNDSLNNTIRIYYLREELQEQQDAYDALAPPPPASAPPASAPPPPPPPPLIPGEPRTPKKK